MKMKRWTRWTSGTLVVALGWLCVAYAEPVPEFYGLYAVDAGDLHEIKDVKDITMSLSPNVRFIYFHKAIASFGGPEVGTRRLSWLRNRTELDGNFGGFDGSPPTNAKRKVTAVRAWGIYTREAQETIIALRSKPVSGQPEMIEYVPSEPFAQGAYELMFEESSKGRFYVGKLPSDDAIEQSEDCIDIESWGTLSGLALRLLPCQGAGAGTGAGSSAAADSASGPTAKAGQPGSTTGAPVTSGAGAKVSADAAKITPEAKALDTQLAKLLQQAPAESKQPDKGYTDDQTGASFAYPADYELTPQKRPIIASLQAPGQAVENRPTITVTMSVPVARLLSPTLDQSVKGTLNGTRAALTESSIAGPVPTKLGGADAQIFFVTGNEEGVLKQKAVTIAVVNKNVLGVVLHATPETFESAWDGYRRVVASYTKK